MEIAYIDGGLGPGMERGEPAFKPEWLKSPNGVLTGNGRSNRHAGTCSNSGIILALICYLFLMLLFIIVISMLVFCGN